MTNDKGGTGSASARGSSNGPGKSKRRSGPPRHSARATRNAGQHMRSRLLDAASALFKMHGLNGTSIAAIAGRADAFPSQVTYYFRTKEALFVEAACRDMLHMAERAERAAACTETPQAYTAALIDSVMKADGLALFVEALTLTRQRPDLVPQVARTIERLHVEGARAYGGEMLRHGWRSHTAADVSARRFWTVALGTALEGHATGRSATAMSAAMQEVLGELAEAAAAEPAATPSLRLVAASQRPPARHR